MVIHGDCIEQMALMPEASVDAIVTDPPYGLEFMGKTWDRLGDVGGRETAPAKPKKRGADFNGRMSAMPSFNDDPNVRCRKCGHWRFSGTPCKCAEPDFPNVRSEQGREMQRWHEAWAREALRVLRPGGYLLSFGGTRTYHRMACAIEDAGFEVRDCIAWLYGQGFPKSLDVSKAIDKAAGAEREVISERPSRIAGGRTYAQDEWTKQHREPQPFAITVPATDLARKWDGWGTALKPAFEPIIVARKPLIGTVVANVLAHGTGALNIDGARIHTPGSEAKPYTVKRLKPGATLEKTGGNWRPEEGREFQGETKAGRWPANVTLDEEAAALLDAQSGVLTSGSGPLRRGADKFRNTYGAFQGTDEVLPPGDSGGASRFFYTAKAGKQDRGKGNTHPTVKPIALMRWLVRLVTPPGGLVLDPFAGSGTTGQAALADGFRCTLIEREAEYVQGIRDWRGAMQLGTGLSA